MRPQRHVRREGSEKATEGKGKQESGEVRATRKGRRHQLRGEGGGGTEQSPAGGDDVSAAAVTDRGVHPFAPLGFETHPAAPPG